VGGGAKDGAVTEALREGGPATVVPDGVYEAATLECRCLDPVEDTDA
jgi:hypothetical protein